MVERTFSLLEEEASCASSAATDGAPGVGGASKSGSCTASVAALLALEYASRGNCLKNCRREGSRQIPHPLMLNWNVGNIKSK